MSDEELEVFKSELTNRLKENHVRGMVQGSEILAKTILELIDEKNYDLTKIKTFCQNTIQSKNLQEAIALGVHNNNKNNKE